MSQSILDIILRTKTEGSAAEAVKGLTDLKSGLDMMIGSFRQAAETVAEVYNETVTKTVEYDLAMRNLSQDLGIGVEETSRIVQAMDDFGISSEQVETALKMAVKNGFAPSIESLAQLADRYNAIQDPVEKADLMVSVLGRNWSTLSPAFREGGDAIRAAAAGISDSLVVTEKAAENARAYQVAMDGLNDSVEAVKMEIGNGLIPVVTRWIDLMFNMPAKLEEGTRAAEEQARTYQEYVSIKIRAAEAEGLFIDKQGTLRDSTMQVVQANYLMEESIWRLINAAKSVPMDPITIRMHYEQGVTPAAPKAPGTDTSAQDKLNASLKAYHEALSGPVSRENERYQAEQTQIREKIKATEKAIDEINRKPWMPGAKEKIQDLKKELDNLGTSQQESAAEHEKNQKRQILAYMEQQMAADGLSQQEQDDLMKISEKWGLVDQSTVAAWEQAKKFTDQLMMARDMGTQVSDAIGAIPTHKEVIVTIILSGATEFYSAWKGSGHNVSKAIGRTEQQYEPAQRAGGGPVSAGRPYIVGEYGPEVFTPGTNGSISPNGAMSAVTFYGPVTFRVDQKTDFDNLMKQLAAAK